MSRLSPFVASGLVAAVLGVSFSAAAWRPIEHRLIGDLGAAAALKALFKALPLPWKDARGAMLANKMGRFRSGTGAGQFTSFGHLVAIYGDMRDNPSALAATPPGRIALMMDFANLGRAPLKLAFKEALHGLELAVANKTHFSSLAAGAYYDRHVRALELAAAAGTTGDRRKLWEAFHHEAFAAHALTDLFAAGHLFIDRREQVNKVAEGKKKILNVLKNPLRALSGVVDLAKGIWGGFTAKRLHDNLNKSGCEVKNLRGDAWLAYGDGKYDQQSAAAKKLAVGAVDESLRSLLRMYNLARERRAQRAGERPFSELARSGAYHGALTYVPVLFRNAKMTGHTLCKQAEHCELLLHTTVNKLLEGKRSEAELSADANAARMAALAKRLEWNKADSVLRPGDVLLLRAEGHPSIVQQVIMKTQKFLKKLFGNKNNEGLASGATTITHAIIYLGEGLIADAAKAGVRINPLSKEKGQILEVYRPADAALAARAAAIARRWANGRMSYRLPLLVPAGNSFFGDGAKADALSYAKAANVAGGPASFKDMFCSHFVLACYQAAALAPVLEKKPSLAAREVRFDEPLDRHASRTATATLHGRLTSATQKGTWKVIGWFEIH